MIKVAPSILSADFTAMGEAVETMEKSGADYIHCDVMDGSFVPPITFGQQMVRDLKKHTRLPLDVHLMIVHPEQQIDAFADAGADLITIHVEAAVHLQRVLSHIRRRGIKAGAVLNPDTPPDVLDYVYDDLDIILLMSVNPGYGGQKLIPAVLDKAKAVRTEIEKRELDIELEIDGGVTCENVKMIKEAGINVLVAGNTIFSSDDPANVIRILKET